jgi:hypothetical protein
MAEHEPKILARTDKWLLIEDFLNFMLCDCRATDYTMASCTLLFDRASATGRMRSGAVWHRAPAAVRGAPQRHAAGRSDNQGG